MQTKKQADNLQDIASEILGPILDQVAKHPDPDLIARSIAAAILGLGVVSPQGNEVIEQVAGILTSRGYGLAHTAAEAKH